MIIQTTKLEGIEKMPAEIKKAVEKAAEEEAKKQKANQSEKKKPTFPEGIPDIDRELRDINSFPPILPSPPHSEI